jgi:hypothetical protein
LTVQDPLRSGRPAECERGELPIQIENALQDLNLLTGQWRGKTQI